MVTSEKLLSTKKMEDYVNKMIGNKYFFQLDTPFACVAKNKKTGEYLLMHSILYKTELIRKIGLKLPHHTFHALHFHGI